MTLKELIAKWEDKANRYVMGSMLPVPVGDMNRIAADVIRRMLADLKEVV